MNGEVSEAGLERGVDFRAFKEHHAHFFYIVDNEIRDDRFKLLMELFKKVGFSIVFPYNIELDKIDYASTYTKYLIKPLKDVENEIERSIKNGENIIYVEKDDAINYLNDMLYMAEEFQGSYSCVLRNESIYEKPAVSIMMGAFGGILKTKKK